METKLCAKCNDTKSMELFTTNAKTGKTQYWCKTCVKEYDHNRHKKQSKKIVAQKKTRRQGLSKWLVELKATLECAWCPETHPACLTFHHTDPATKETEVAQAVAWGWSKERILNEINKCIVLCFNCHTKHHFAYKYRDVV